MKTAPLAAAILLLALSGNALAHGRVQIGIGIGVPIYGGGYYGGPFYGPRYYGGPFYYPPYYPVAPVVVSPPPVIVTPPPVYVSQPAAAVAPPAPPVGIQPQDNSPYWYYCPSSSTYYPYARGCASGWQQITPPPQPGD